GAVIDNAVRAASEGTGARRVDVRCATAGPSILIEIADSGPGIPSPILGRIFDPFFGTREVGEGKGLGLSVAYGIVRGHDGELTARTLAGAGACSTMRTPGAPATAETRPQAALSEGGKRRGARGGKILLVDDEPVVLDLLTDVLGEVHAIETAT